MAKQLPETGKRDHTRELLLKLLKACLNSEAAKEAARLIVELNR